MGYGRLYKIVSHSHITGEYFSFENVTSQYSNTSTKKLFFSMIINFLTSFKNEFQI